MATNSNKWLFLGYSGNLLPRSKMMQKPIAGGGGKIWSTLSQYADSLKTVEEAEKRLQVGFDIVKNACTKNNEPDAFGAAEAFNLIGRVPDDSINLGRSIKEPHWYRRMTHINLPDAHVGYAVLDIDEAGSRLQTFIR